eukprot:12418669-Karenia_brevis.AAC.1
MHESGNDVTLNVTLLYLSTDVVHWALQTVRSPSPRWRMALQEDDRSGPEWKFLNLWESCHSMGVFVIQWYLIEIGVFDCHLQAMCGMRALACTRKHNHCPWLK